MDRTRFEIAHAELLALGIVLHQAPGEYRVNWSGGAEATVFRTDDLEAALKRGRAMANEARRRSEPPLGPTGPRSSRRAVMYAHNKRVAARRAKRSRTD